MFGICRDSINSGIYEYCEFFLTANQFLELCRSPKNEISEYPAMLAGSLYAGGVPGSRTQLPGMSQTKY